jgi:type 1 glutamine amidotransferase
MNLTPKIWRAIAVFGVAVLSANAAPLRVLYFTKSSGYEHSVIKWENGQPSYSERVLTKLGAKEGITFTFSKDGSKFSPEYLGQFDVVMFYTSGDLTSVGTDGNPAMSAAGKQALLDWVAGGHGFMALHAGSDSFHTGEHGGGNPKERSQRYRNYGDAADSYVKMLGGEFIRHGPQQVATARVVDRDFPGFGGLGAAIRVQEEWYTLKEFAANDHVLLVMETKGMEGSDYQRPDYPLAWARTYGKGRVAFNAMGHREDVWDSAAFQSMLTGMLKWAGGVVNADVTPNLEQAAPGHATIQPQPPPEPAKK